MNATKTTTKAGNGQTVRMDYPPDTGADAGSPRKPDTTAGGLSYLGHSISGATAVQGRSKNGKKNGFD